MPSWQDLCHGCAPSPRFFAHHSSNACSNDTLCIHPSLFFTSEKTSAVVCKMYVSCMRIDRRNRCREGAIERRRMKQVIGGMQQVC
jgi:hypothetical protein